MPETQVNWLAVLVAAIVGSAIGGLWYSTLFGKTWARLANLPEDELRSGTLTAYGLGFVCTFVMSYVMALLVGYVFRAPADRTIGNGLLLALIVWAGFVATTSLTNDLFGRRPIRRWIIESLHFLVVILFMGALLSRWT